jgi:NAD+ kinase
MNIILFSRRQINHRATQLETILSAIEGLGLDYCINEDFADVVEVLTQRVIAAERRYVKFPDSCDDSVLVTVGGDGTLLDAVGMLQGRQLPVVGINCGRLGYLTADDGDGIAELFDRLVRNEVCFERRQMLSVSGDIEASCLALNEVTIHRHGATMISVEALINDNTIATYHGDGLIISTPTGSTAYSLSVGGPVVDPMCRCFILSPLAPHNLTMRPVVVPDNVHITLRLSARGGEAFLSADNRTFTLRDGACIELQPAAEQLILATPHNNTFYDTLREKMMWGVDKR